MRRGESECDKEPKKMKDTRQQNRGPRAQSGVSRALSLLIYNNVLHKIPRLVQCPDTHSTGAPASVSESRSHQPNGDFAGGPCIRTESPLSKASCYRHLANGLWIPQPAAGHSRRGRPWCRKGMTWMLRFMKRSFGIFAGLADGVYKSDTHLTTDTNARFGFCAPIDTT